MSVASYRRSFGSVWMLRVTETPVVPSQVAAEMTRITPFKLEAGLFRVRLGIYLLFTNFRFMGLIRVFCVCNLAT